MDALDEVKEHSIINAAYAIARDLTKPDMSKTPEAVSQYVIRLSRLLADGMREDFNKPHANA